MSGQTVGYKRVSTSEQKTDRQLEGIQLDEVFEDKASGKDLQRPELERLMRHVRKGDTLVVHSMDRLARNLGDLLKIVESLNSRGVKVRFIKETLEFSPSTESNPMAKLMLSMLGAVAEFERALIRERQREGIALAKQQGVYKGRKPSLGPEQILTIKNRLASGAKVTQIAKELKVTRQTIYRHLEA